MTGKEGDQGGVSTLKANVREVTVTENLVRCYRLTSWLGGQQASYLEKSFDKGLEWKMGSQT